MNDTPTSPASGDNADGHVGAQPAPRESSGTPRWVKVFAVVGFVLVALVIVMLFTGHGAGRHTGGPSHAAGPAAALGGAHHRLGFGS